MQHHAVNVAKWGLCMLFQWAGMTYLPIWRPKGLQKIQICTHHWFPAFQIVELCQMPLSEVKNCTVDKFIYCSLFTNSGQIQSRLILTPSLVHVLASSVPITECEAWANALLSSLILGLSQLRQLALGTMCLSSSTFCSYTKAALYLRNTESPSLTSNWMHCQAKQVHQCRYVGHRVQSWVQVDFENHPQPISNPYLHSNSLQC